MRPRQKAGQVTVPIMFRLAAPEMEYVINHSECKAFIVAKDFVQMANSIRSKLPDDSQGELHLFW